MKFFVFHRKNRFFLIKMIEESIPFAFELIRSNFVDKMRDMTHDSHQKP